MLRMIRRLAVNGGWISLRRSVVTRSKSQSPVFPLNSHPDFLSLRTDGLKYYDKTRFITILENNLEDKVVLMLRPRRFGKSLFISTLETFHDFNLKDQFQSVFKGLDVYEDVVNNIVENGRYLILKFDFSIVSISPTKKAVDSLRMSLLMHIELFCHRYYRLYGFAKKDQMVERIIGKNEDVATSLLSLYIETSMLIKNNESNLNIGGVSLSFLFSPLIFTLLCVRSMWLWTSMIHFPMH